MKRILSLLLSLLALMALTACGGPKAPGAEGPHRLKVVATVFPAYDFARAAGGEWADVTLLLPPGAETHSYEPTPADILAVQDCDLFLYLGGDSDAWVDTILESVQPSGAVLRMIDCVELLEEETVEGMTAHGHDHEDHDSHEHELGEVLEADEHVWTSPVLAKTLCEAICDALCRADPAHQENYRARLADYLEELTALDEAFRDTVAAGSRRLLVFGDRFPLLYFCREYGLDYRAAFHGCASDTEPSLATLKYLIDQVAREQIPVVYTIELSSQKVAQAIAETTGARVLTFQSCQTVSRQDLDNGATYLSLMWQNVAALKEGLS